MRTQFIGTGEVSRFPQSYLTTSSTAGPYDAAREVMMGRSRGWFILAMVAVIVGWTASDRVRADGALYGEGTATVDGVLSPGEWDEAGFVDLPVNLPGGGTTPARLFVMNDSQNLYLALTFDHGETVSTSLAFEFDSNNSGVLDDGDDGFGVNPSFFSDLFRSTSPPCPPNALCSMNDTDASGTNDGAGAIKQTGTTYVVEMSHPLDTGDVGHDFALSAGDSIGYYMSLRMIRQPGVWPNDFGDTDLYPAGTIKITPLPPANEPPDTSQAAPGVASIWPPNKRMVGVSIRGVTDPDGDPVTITITGISNNETGSADAAGIGTSTAYVRADRNGRGGGRIYTISFTADDGKGGTADGAVTVVVPHNPK